MICLWPKYTNSQLFIRWKHAGTLSPSHTKWMPTHSLSHTRTHTDTHTLGSNAYGVQFVACIWVSVLWVDHLLSPIYCLYIPSCALSFWWSSTPMPKQRPIRELCIRLLTSFWHSLCHIQLVCFAIFRSSEHFQDFQTPTNPGKRRR